MRYTISRKAWRGYRYSNSDIPQIRLRLNKAFKMARKEGLIAQQNFLCCLGCACAGIGEIFTEMSPEKRAKVKGVVFYHSQDAFQLREKGQVNLGYGQIVASDDQESPLTIVEVGKIVCDCLTKAGLDYEWDGNPDKRILVKGLKAETPVVLEGKVS